MKIRISIINDNEMKAFSCYLSPSAKKGEAIIKLNLEAIAETCKKEKITFKKFLSYLTVHELAHIFQELYERRFDEKEVEKALKKLEKRL